MKNFAMAHAMKRRAKKMKEGGEVAYKSGYGSRDQDFQEGVHSQAAHGAIGTSTAGHAVRNKQQYAAKGMHKEALEELRAMKKPNLYADGGMIERIISQHYSDGGEVANDVGVAEADEEPAEYDDLVLRDDMDGEQPMDSNEHGDSRVSDELIDRIMLKKKKDHLPRPA